MTSLDPIPPFELIWCELGNGPEIHQLFATRAAADNRILEIRFIAREWVLFQDEKAIDWGISER